MAVEGYRGKTVVVTGASSGMGAATAQLLVEAGAEVQALDVKDVEVAVAKTLAVDLRDPVSIAAAVEQLPDRIDALFNCAGLPQTFGARDVMAVNFLGLRALTEALVPRLPHGSAIASIASTGGADWPHLLEPIRELLAIDEHAAALEWIEAHPEIVDSGYRFSKACVVVYSMSRTADLLSRGIRINVLSPGDTSTPMTARFREFYGAEFWDSRVLPIGRPAQPVEQAHAMLFLNDPSSSYVAGINLVVDGGATAARLMGDVPVPEGQPGMRPTGS